MELVNEEILEQKLKSCLDRRRLPDAFLYIGDGGTNNWLTLEASARFPVAAALTTLMKEHADDFARRTAHCRNVVSVGAGDAQKERLLLSALRHYSRPACQIVDVSRPMVDRALHTLCGLDIDMQGVAAFCEDLDQLSPRWLRPTLLCLLGNNFSNYDPDLLLDLIGRNLGPADMLLLDASLLPEDRQELDRWMQETEAIYRAPENIWFNIAPLVARGMDRDGCGFELELMCQRQPWGEVWRTRKRIHVLRPAVVRCGEATVSFSKGEVIEMGFTYKYRLTQLQDCLEGHGFGLTESRVDPTGGNAILLAVKRMMEAMG